MPARKPSRTKKRSRKRTQTSDPAQYARFLETAKKLEADETGQAFERAMGALVPRKTR